jgi:3-methylcrotonyl-CoA carboxylase alpha subunit
VIESLLVANRGEIAVRIFATCRRLGIRTVAVFSDADAASMHVAAADQALYIGPSPASASYLNMAAILDASRRAQVQAIHPGYGFLSENPDFADAVVSAGLLWVGPPPNAMRAIGDKAHAKALAELNDVPILAGYHHQDQSLDTLRRQAESIGYPLLIKASAGGGGRGMRVVESAALFADSVEAARREALASFGDDRVLLERYVARPRHVEVQIFGDQHGNLVHLGERECSVQRRHQKLIEESPSPVVGPDLRRRMGEAAVRLARAAGYFNAGTVEFLVDEQLEFAFLEVNARLQVEHPVTELVTGLDLVELQLRVAAGEPLDLSQDDVRLVGHALEARVIAEDASAGFLPSSGRIDRFVPPAAVRVDTWIGDGTVVSPYYDSLLAKVIGYGHDRASALSRLTASLSQAWIDGVTDNIDLLLATLEHPAFRRGDLHTSFLDTERIVAELGRVPSHAVAAAGALDALRAPSEQDPWRATSAWRIGGVDRPSAWQRGGQVHTVSISDQLGGPGVLARVEADLVEVQSLGDEALDRARLSVDGQAATVWRRDDRRVVEYLGRHYRFRVPPPLSVEQTSRDRGAVGSEGRLVAPMPGRVVKIAVTPGEEVIAHQPLLVLEAMKMEHVVESPYSAVVREVYVGVGQQVQGGTRLLTLGDPAIDRAPPAGQVE